MAETTETPRISQTVRAYIADFPRLDRIVEALLPQNPKASRTDAIRAALEAWERQQEARGNGAEGR